MKEPMWKTVLCWASVITFFGLPITILIIQIYAASHPYWLNQEILKTFIEPHIAYLQSLQRDVTFIVMGLAGLRAIEQIRANGKKNNGEPQPLKKV